MNAVLSLWAERSWESARQRALNRPRMWHLVLLANHFVLQARLWWLCRDLNKTRWAAGVCVLSWCCNFVSPPPGELCGRGWSQLGEGHSGDTFWRDLGGKRPRRWCTNRAYHIATRRPWVMQVSLGVLKPGRHLELLYCFLAARGPPKPRASVQLWPTYYKCRVLGVNFFSHGRDCARGAALGSATSRPRSRRRCR
jgi:hypothetical protein